MKRDALRLLLAFFTIFACILRVDARTLDQLDHRRWIAADGGPSQVGAIAQTADGYLWMGTNDSLFRFDGFRFVRYAAPGHDAPGIVASLLAVDEGLWVGLRAGGASLISPTGLRHYEGGRDMPGGVIYSLARDRGGAVWAAANDGLARFDGSRWQTVAADWKFPGHGARAVFADRAGVVWAANEERLFYLPEGAHGFIDTGLAVNWASQIAQARDGSIWVTERYRGVVHKVTMSNGVIAHGSMAMDTPVSGLLFDGAGALWISTLGNGLRYFADAAALETASGQAAGRAYTTRDGLSADYIWPLLEDSEGNVWAGTSAGLDRFRAKTLMPAAFAPGALNFALAAGSDGGLWAGTSNRPVMRLARDGLHTLDMPAPVTCAMRDADGDVWMGGPAGIWRSSGGRLLRVAALPVSAPAESSVRAMARDAAGDVWVSINRAGLFVLHEGAWRTVAPVSQLPSQAMPVSASADPSGRLWFGYRDDLLVMRDGDTQRRWGAEEGMHVGHVTALSHQGERTWVGGQHGAGFIEDGRFHALRLPANGLFDNIYAIIAVPLVSGAGTDLWIHAKAGIFQMPAAELERAGSAGSQEIRYRAYNLMGGLANDPYQVLPLPTAVRGGDGRLWFSTSNGVVWLDPDSPAPDDVPPKAAIDSVSADGIRLPASTSAQLASDTRRVVMEYTASSLSSPESLHFRYRLDGYDNDWQDAGRQREAVYTGLGAGDYRFRVVAYTGNGVPSEREAVYAFNIAPVFYRRPLFLFVVGVLLWCALWILYRLRVRRAAEQLQARLEARLGERERIARELHDTLLQGVQGVMLRFQAVTDMLALDQPARRSLEQAMDRADQVLAEGRDRVRDLRDRGAGRGELANALASAGRELEQRGGAAFVVTVQGTVRPLQPRVLDEAYRIGHEAIVNAYTHAGAKEVTLLLDYAPRRFRMTICDDGIGIDVRYLTPRGRADHWGLRGMHERATGIGGRLEVASTLGRGSQVRLSVRGSRAYRRTRPGMFQWLRLRKHGGNEA